MDAVVRAVARARSVCLRSYLLPRGKLEAALAAAARAGAHVDVTLEGRLAGGAGGGAGRSNAAAAARLRAAGATVRVLTEGGSSLPILHDKSIEVDGVRFLDDCNWSDADGTIVRATRAVAELAQTKSEALASEASLLRKARTGDSAIVESESFGAGNAVYAAIRDAAVRGVHVRLLVNDRELRKNAGERTLLQNLSRIGIEYQACSVSDKFAVLNGAEAWVGSANATFTSAPQRDWGLRAKNSGLCASLVAAFTSHWRSQARDNQ